MEAKSRIKSQLKFINYHIKHDNKIKEFKITVN